MSLEKLFIDYTKKNYDTIDGEIKVLFNPNTINIRRSTNVICRPRSGGRRPQTEAANSNPAILSLNLFVDTYEKGTNVRDETKKIEALTIMGVQSGRHEHAPPVCYLRWGESGYFFKGILQSVTTNYTLFFENGWPARATMQCSFKEYILPKDLIEQAPESADVVKTWTVKSGDTLSSISGEVYADCSLWRNIAEANRINDPFAILPGMVLAIPALSAQRKIR